MGSPASKNQLVYMQGGYPFNAMTHIWLQPQSKPQATPKDNQDTGGQMQNQEGQPR